VIKLLSLLVAIVLAALLSGCGGSGITSGTSGGGETKETVNLLDTTIHGTSTGETDSARILLRCDIDNILDDACSFEYVEVFYPMLGTSMGYPVSVTLKNGEEYMVEVPVADESIKKTEPFLYMNEENPSNSHTEWTIRTSVISNVETETVGHGYERCETTEQPPDGNGNPQPPLKTCYPGESFSSRIGGNEPGTVAIFGDGVKKLEESYIGLLTGTGNGIIRRNGISTSLEFSITGGVAVGSPVVATYMTPLSEFFVTGDATLTYGDLTLTLDGFVLKDDTGKVYGEYDATTGKITWLEPLGSHGSVIVVTYESEPFVGFGGELVGYGNGNDSVYEIQTRYQYIVSDTLRVFSTQGEGEVLLIDPVSGTATVRFPEVVEVDEPIKVSYQTYKVVMPVEIYIYTSRGTYKRTLTYSLEMGGVS
jgi:hypothetical protein